MQTYSNVHGWNFNNYRYYKQIQTLLHEALINENREHWHTLINKVSSTYKDPTTFWKKIKLLTGNKEKEPHYILNKNNIKLDTNVIRKEYIGNIGEKYLMDCLVTKITTLMK